MLQWTGGSRRKVATSRKSTHSRQKQYFEQRKRQRQAPGQENHAKGSYMEGLHSAEPRSLDILNLINLTVASQQVSTELTVSENYEVANISDDCSLAKLAGGSSSVSEETRLAQLSKSSDSDLPQICQNDPYKCAGNVNKWKMQESLPEHTSSCPVDTLNAKKEKPQIEANVLDLLDDEPYSNGRSIPEAHVALLVEGLGKIGSQTPAHSPRNQNRFSCKVMPIPSKPSKRFRSSSDLESFHSDFGGKLNSMIDDFSPPPLCNKSSPGAYVSIKTPTRKSNIAPLPLYSLAEQIEKISIKRRELDPFFLASNEKNQNDNFGYLETHFNDEGYDVASQNQRTHFWDYPFLNSSNKIYETSDVQVKDIFLGSTRNLWDEGENIEASATTTPHFRPSALEASFIWDSANVDGIFNSPAWNYLPTEDFQDNISLLSENSNSSPAERNKTSPSFGTRSMKPVKSSTESNEKIRKFYEGDFIGTCSQDENIFTGFDDTVWGKKQKGNFAFKTKDSCFPDQIFSCKTASIRDPFSSFTRRKCTTPSGYKSMNQDDHFDLFSMPESKYETSSGCKTSNDFIFDHEMFSKQSVFDLNSHIPMNPSSKVKVHSQYSSGGDFCKEINFTHLPKYEYNEDRGSSGKPHPKDAEKKSTSSGNAESAAGAESPGKVSEHEESKNEIPEPSDSTPGGEKYNEEAEVIPTAMEEFPTQIQNYVRSKIIQIQ